MKTYIPVNLTTQRKYKPVTEDRKTAMEKNPHTAGKYRFELITEANAPVVNAPKKAEPTAKPPEKKVDEK
jgi:hypothetical protein